MFVYLQQVVSANTSSQTVAADRLGTKDDSKEETKDEKKEEPWMLAETFVDFSCVHNVVG